VLTLTGERFALVARLLAADDIEPCLAPVKDGWRTVIRGYTGGRAWTKQYVLGFDPGFFVQENHLLVIIDTLLADGRAGSGGAGASYLPPTGHRGI
jgi:hypothetical protein